MRHFFRTITFVCFDDAENEGDKSDNEGKNETKTFTQEEVNSFLAKEKRKTQDAQKQLASQLQEYKKTAELSTEEKTELEKQIEDLQKQYMTAEERARQTSEKITKKFKKDLEALESERNSWKDRYTRSTIDAAIAQAAVTNKAIAVEQIAAMLRPSAKLAEKLDEAGKPTGMYEPRVEFQDLDRDEKPITLDLTVNEAVKRMTELPQYGNLFKGNKAGGIGGSGGTGKKMGQIDLIKIAREDPARYRKLRKEQPELFANL